MRPSNNLTTSLRIRLSPAEKAAAQAAARAAGQTLSAWLRSRILPAVRKIPSTPSTSNKTQK